MRGHPPLDVDVLVIGGGPAGSACGIRLARGGARVAIVEASDFSRVPYRDYRLTSLQKLWLEAWVAGNFVSDWTGLPAPAAELSAAGLTRAALEGTVGQGFFPGIEGGILLTDPTLYRTPFDFRLDPAQLAPGDVTALMAVPWQADFLECEEIWWPSQRPDRVRPSATATTRANWARGINDKASLVRNFPRLAFITAQTDGQGNVVFAESQRAPQGQIA